MTTSNERAKLIRSRHKRLGGDLSTRQLAALLGISSRAVLGYVLGQSAPDTTYTPIRKSNTLPSDLILCLSKLGVGVNTIASYYKVNPSRINYIIQKARDTQ